MLTSSIYHLSFLIKEKWKLLFTYVHMKHLKINKSSTFIRLSILKEKGGEMIKLENEEGINKLIKTNINLGEFISGKQQISQDGSYYPIIIEAVNYK